MVCLAIRKQQVREFCLSSFMSTDTNLYVCASRNFNRALPSGLIAEERTWQLLEIEAAEHDYRVALSKVNLKSSRLWAFIKESQGILVPPIYLVLPLLCLRHVIHVVFGGSDLQPLMVEELSLV